MIVLETTFQTGSKLKHFVRFFLSLVMVTGTLTAVGCGGGKFIPFGERVRNADRQFDTAEAFLIKADKDKEEEKRREQIEQMKLLYDEALIASQVTLNIAGISIAVVIHSLDPLECGDWAHHDSIDISLRWSENQTTKEHLLKACHRSKNECCLLNELVRQG